MKPTPALAALCLLGFSLPSVADTFVLKNGTSLEATILSETPENYLLEVQVTPGIKDEREVAKTDVTKISRESADAKAFQLVAKQLPSLELTSAAEYAPRIAVVEKFLKQHALSNKAAEAKAILKTLTSEAADLTAGGTKVNGEVISPAEYEANAYEFDARIQETAIRNLAAEGDILGALRLFSEFDANFRTTLSFGALTPLVQQMIQNQAAEAQQSLSSLPTRLKEREIGLKRMTAADRNGTQVALKEETAGVQARYLAEKSSKYKWVTTSPFHKTSLEETVKLGETELKRLAAVKTVLGMDGGKAYRELYKVVKNGGDGAAVTAALTQARTALIPTRYLEPLETAAKGRK